VSVTVLFSVDRQVYSCLSLGYFSLSALQQIWLAKSFRAYVNLNCESPKHPRSFFLW